MVVMIEKSEQNMMDRDIMLMWYSMWYNVCHLFLFSYKLPSYCCFFYCISYLCIYIFECVLFFCLLIVCIGTLWKYSSLCNIGFKSSVQSNCLHSYNANNKHSYWAQVKIWVMGISVNMECVSVNQIYSCGYLLGMQEYS